MPDASANYRGISCLSIAAGYFAFGEIPGGHSILGMAVIVGAGGIVLWHQHASPRG